MYVVLRWHQGGIILPTFVPCNKLHQGELWDEPNALWMEGLIIKSVWCLKKLLNNHTAVGTKLHPNHSKEELLNSLYFHIVAQPEI